MQLTVLWTKPTIGQTKKTKILVFDDDLMYTFLN